MRTLRYVSLAVCLIAGTHVYGQFEPNTQEVRGRLIGSENGSYGNYSIEITSMADRSFRARADVLPDGNFVLRDLHTGDYVMRVLNAYDSEVAMVPLSVLPGSMGTPCEIRLPEEKLQRPISGTVSVQELSHPMSKQVRKLLTSGQKLFEEQHYPDAAARFREAIEDDPKSSQAHAELGMALFRMEHVEEAIVEYRAAAKLDPANSVVHSNLASLLASTNQAGEAESEAAAALRLDPANGRAHYVMAAVLLHRPGQLDLAVSHLMAARNSFLPARRALERICAAAPQSSACAN